jgi:integrase
MTQHRESPSRRTNPSGKTVWVARYTAADGKRRSAGTFTKKGPCGAVGRGDCCAQHAIDAAYGQPVNRGTVGAYATDWTRRHPRSDRTNQTNDGRIRQVLNVKLEGRPLRDWPLAELRRRHALDLVDHMLRHQGRAATGATNILRALSAMTEDAITDELLGANPFKGVRVRRSDPRAVKPSRRPRVLSWQQMHTFAAAASTRKRVHGRDVIVPAPMFEPMLRTIADCGLRVGELFALRRDLQDLRTGVFTVAGSGWEGRLVDSSDTKEHDRSGPIPPTCLQLLRAMPTRIDSPWLFPTSRGRMWMVNNFYRDVWRPTRDASGIDCTPHDFRHSYVSNLAAAGVDVADLADMTGHTVETAQARYRHALRRSFDQVREAIG